MKHIAIGIIIIGFIVVCGYGETSERIDISIECIDAYFSVVFDHPRYFDTPITQEYFGYSGTRESFVPRRMILTLRFNQEIVEGEYTFVDNQKDTVRITGQVDSDGDILLQEVLDGNNHHQYTFRGKLTEQEIKGMWGVGSGLLEGFEFFATTDKHSPWLRPKSLKFPDKQGLLYATDRYGNTNLHIVARHRQTSSVEYLLMAGAEINVRNQEGQTPLHKTIDWERSQLAEKDLLSMTDVVKLLVNSGADINARDNNGFTPLDIAQQNNLEEVVELLRKFEAKE